MTDMRGWHSHSHSHSNSHSHSHGHSHSHSHSHSNSHHLGLAMGCMIADVWRRLLLGTPDVVMTHSAICKLMIDEVIVYCLTSAVVVQVCCVALRAAVGAYSDAPPSHDRIS